MYKLLSFYISVAFEYVQLLMRLLDSGKVLLRQLSQTESAKDCCDQEGSDVKTKTSQHQDDVLRQLCAYKVRIT